MVLIEVRILDYTIVLVCDDDSTISDIQHLAMAEYATFNMKKEPQKVLFTRDDQGRILSGTLKIVENQISTILEIVLVDYSASDYLNPHQTEELYREWQVWTATKIKEYIQGLSYEEFPSYPLTHVLSLLDELCDSKKDQVQSICVKTLQIIMTKFSQKDLVIKAADRLSKIFAETSFSDIAILALESFKGLSSLQVKLFNSSEYIRKMFNVQSALLRFSSDKQTELFAAFESVSSLLGDEELINVIKSQQYPLQQQEEEESSNLIKNTVDLNITNKSYKPFNHKRLESLLSSDDPKIRLYALEKLYKVLCNAKHYIRNVDSKKSLSESSLKATEAYELRPAPEQHPAVGKLDSDDEISKQLLIMKDRYDLENILQCLFRCLKRCIKARAKQNPNPRTAKSTNDVVNDKRIDGISTAGRLIEIALNSPETELSALQLVIDCVWYIVHLPVDHLLSERPVYSSKMKFKVTGNPLTTVQMIFASVAKEWQRLLLTLSHAAEANNFVNYHDLADKCAYFFLLVTCCGSTEGWENINIEAPAICSFLMYHRPCFRSYLGLAYMTYLSSYILKHQQSRDSFEDVNETGKESLDILKLKELLLFKNFAITKHLWQWATSSDHSKRKSAVLALDCISSSCVFSDVNTFLIKLDPINRLAAILRYAVRNKDIEQKEFAVQNLDSRLDNFLYYFGDDYHNIHPEQDDEIIDEREFKFAVDESIGMHGDSSTSSLNSVSSTNTASVGNIHDQKFVYPDLLLIRFILKTISNLVNSPNTNNIYDQAYRNELAKWIVTAEVGPPQASNHEPILNHIDNHPQKKSSKVAIKLSRIAKADSVVMLYFNLINKDHI